MKFNVKKTNKRQDSTSNSNYRLLEADEQKTFSNLAANKGEMERNLIEKDNSYTKINHQYETFKKEHDQKLDELHKKSELLQTLTTGISAEEGHESGYMEQLQSKFFYLFFVFFIEMKRG